MFMCTSCKIDLFHRRCFPRRKWRKYWHSLDKPSIIITLIMAYVQTMDFSTLSTGKIKVNIIQRGSAPPERYYWEQEQNFDYRWYNAPPTRHHNVASNYWRNILAICYQICGIKVEQFENRPQNQNARIYFARHWSRQYSSKILQYALFSNLRNQCPPPEFWRRRPTKMWSAFEYWSITWALAVPFWQRGTCVESNHRLNNTPIPCSIQW